MTPDRVLRAPRDEADWLGYAGMAFRAFGWNPFDASAWVSGRRVRDAVCRVAVEGGTVVGGALAYPVAQRYGGRPVPAGAVAVMAVAPERRGRGVALAVLRALDDAMREAGLVVSPLWPSTAHVYRRAGWEVAGGAVEAAVPARSLASLRAAGDLVVPDLAAASALQSRLADEWNGPIVRPGWWWDWRHAGSAAHERTLVGWAEEGLTGLLTWAWDRATGGTRVEVTDLWAATPDAARGLLGHLGFYVMVAPEIAFDHTALPPGLTDLTWLLPEQDVRTASHVGWMLRLVDPAPALTARGWPPGAAARVDLEVHDPLRGPRRLVLEVEAGEARTRSGGRARVRLGAGALAAWYAGGLSATRAARLGLAEGPARDLRALDALTADRPPFLPDAF